jgi:hypothetical protein
MTLMFDIIIGIPPVNFSSFMLPRFEGINGHFFMLINVNRR